MAKNSYLINMCVIDRKSRRGIPGLRFEAWDKDLICDDLVGSAVTDQQGAFTIEFTHSYFQELFFDRRPDLFFKVFLGDKLIKSTEDSVLWNVEAGDTQIQIEVDMPDTPQPKSDPKTDVFTVAGQILQPDGSPLAGGTIYAFDKDMRSEERLGHSTADSSGRYEIRYTAGQFRRNEKKTADLIVRVLDAAGRQLAASPVQFNAPQAATIDIAIPGDYQPPSEYEQLIAAITPVAESIQLAALSADDVTFALGETGIDRRHIELLVIASQHSRETGLAPEVFYGLLRQDFPTDLFTLLSNAPQDLRRGLGSSLREHIVPTKLQTQLDSILAALQQLLLKYALKPATNGGAPSLGDLLGTSTLSRAQQEAYLSLATSSDNSSDDFWNTLRQDPAFRTPGAVDDLQMTLQLGALTLHNVPLVNALQTLRRQGTVKSLRDLVKLDSAGWAKVLNTPVNGQPIEIPDSIPGGTPAEKMTNYIGALTDTLRTAFPTAAAAQRVAVQPTIDLGLVRTVLARNPQFDPADYLPGSLDWTGISAADQARAQVSLELLRREIKMFPNLDRSQLLPQASATISSRAPIAASTSPYSNPIRTGVSTFLNNSQDFDLHATHIDSYVAANATAAFHGIPEEQRPAVIDHLRRTQRVFRIDPSYDHVEALMSEGLNSAYSIASVPRNTFAGQFTEQLGGDTAAGMVHRQASQVTAGTTSFSAQIRQTITDASPRVLGQSSQLTFEIVKQLPNWETLFGSLSFCACGHCRSVYSPAAYLVDILQFLDRLKTNNKATTPLNVLLRRRPDIEYIKLSCENAETPLPYVDLVNEILEAYIAFGKLDASTAKDTGDLSAAALSANPQYLTEKAYDTTRNAVYPLSLPFHRPLAVARTYLEHLGTSMDQVMSTFQNSGAPADLAIACEYLRISPQEHVILTGTDMQGNFLISVLATFYGYPPATSFSTMAAHLTSVPELLRRTGIQYLDLIELLKTHFLNPLSAIVLDVPDGVDPCDLSQMTIGPLDSAALHKFHRFIRLWKKLGWEVRELDNAIGALGAADIDDVLLSKLAAVKRLETDLKLPLDRLLSLWADIDTDGRDCLYVMLFQNRTVLKPVDPAFELNYVATLAAPLNVTFPDSVSGQIFYDPATLQLRFTGAMTSSQRDDLLRLAVPLGFDPAIDSLYNMRGAVALASSTEFLSDHVNTILAALRIGATDLAAIRTAAGLADPDPSKVQMNLANLATLYRYTALAKALKVSVNDCLALIALSGLDPFSAGAPASTVLFVDTVRSMRQSAFPILQLNYLYRDHLDPKRGIAPTQAAIDPLLLGLQTALNKIVDDTEVLPDPTGDLLRQKLAILVDAGQVDSIMSLVDGTAVYSTPLASQPGLVFPSPLDLKFSFGGTAQAPLLRFAGAMTGPERAALTGFAPVVDAAIQNLFQQPRDLIAANPALFPDPIDAAAKLIDKTPPIPINPFDYVLAPLMAFLRDTLSRNLIAQTLSGNLKLDTKLADLLLTGGQAAGGTALLKSRADATKPAVVDFLALAALPAYGATPLPEDPVTDTAKASYRLLHKVALLVNTFKMTLDEVVYLSAHGSDFAGTDPANAANTAPFDLNALPLDPTSFQPALFSQWQRLNALFALRDSLSRSEVGLLDVFTAATMDDVQAKLAAATGWDPAELDFLIGANGFLLAPADFKNEIAIVRLQTCWALIKRLGVSANVLFHWAAVEPGPATAQEIQNTAKAQYDEETWLTIAKPLNDVLRSSRKAALIAYLLADQGLRAAGITDSSGLFEYFLIDVDMSPCMMTSRIVQASAAVQLFVQRCLLNLEEGKADPTQDVAPTAIDTEQWQWMSQYRVWEANRKVFLYPENWILPELRDNKSQFFKELENELMQNDITEDTAERAIMNYLEKLHEVARLDIRGMYWEENDDAIDPLTGESTKILHVFGRTFHAPYVYYYRNLATATGVWTPWEKVSLDIQGDHLIPIVWNRRLYLFWPVFEEKPDTNQDLPGVWAGTAEDWAKWKEWEQSHHAWETIDAIWNSPTFKALLAVIQTKEAPPQEPSAPAKPSTTSQPSLTHWEISLAWSEYARGKWTAKHVSSEFISSETVPNVRNGEFVVLPAYSGKEEVINAVVQLYLPTKEEHYLKTVKQTDQLIFRLYRRYEAPIPSIGTYLSQVAANDFLGSLRFACSAEVNQVPEDTPTHALFSPLSGPDTTTNSFMSLSHSAAAGDGLQSTDKGKTTYILNGTKDYDLLIEHQVPKFTLAPYVFQHFFYQDSEKTYAVHPWRKPGSAIPADRFLKFDIFFHPHVCSFITALNSGGVPALLALDTQQVSWQQALKFELYEPQDTVSLPHPVEDVDFSSSGAYSLYNWELFFHIPLLIATRLTANQRFEEAQHWFHYIFNPMENSSTDPVPNRFWRTLPFNQNNEDERIQELLKLLTYQDADPKVLAQKENFREQITEWRNKPFDPHMIARLRLSAYQKTVVMKYIDNLIAWGDYLFTQDSRESVNSAIQLYVLAADILGPRPQEVTPARRNILVETYHDLRQQHLDEFSNVLVNLENQFSFTDSVALGTFSYLGPLFNIVV